MIVKNCKRFLHQLLLPLSVIIARKSNPLSMRSNYTAIVVILFFSPCLSHSPFTIHHLPLKYLLLAKIPLNGGSFSTDNLQNVYIYSGSLLEKYDAAGKMLCQHDDKSYGDISYIDVTDPMKVMVFYKDFPEIVFLDNTLSVNGSPISPGDMGYPLATLACTSHNNGLWLYDAQGFQLVRLDVNLNVTQKTGNLIQSLGIRLNPDYLLEYNDYVYMNDPAQGILVFDQYGTYYKTIPFTGLTTFEVRGKNLFYMKNDTIHTFHLNTIIHDVTPAPDSLAKQVRIEKNLLFESLNDTVRVYKITN